MPADAIYRDPALSRAFRDGLVRALGRAPSPALLRRWASGYRQYVWLVSSIAGKSLMSERDKQRVRPEVYEGAFGSFPAAYAEAVDCSRRALDRTIDFVEDPRTEPAFDAAVPAGPIDDLV